MKKSAVSLVLLLALGVSPGGAEQKFQLVETQKGLVRLDLTSGEVSYCREVGGGMACTVSADERSALLQATQELSDRVSALETRLIQLEKDGADRAVESDAPVDKAEPRLSPQEEGQVDKAMRVTENVMRRFIAIFKDLKQEFETN